MNFCQLLCYLELIVRSNLLCFYLFLMSALYSVLYLSPLTSIRSESFSGTLHIFPWCPYLIAEGLESLAQEPEFITILAHTLCSHFFFSLSSAPDDELISWEKYANTKQTVSPFDLILPQNTYISPPNFRNTLTIALRLISRIVNIIFWALHKQDPSPSFLHRPCSPYQDTGYSPPLHFTWKSWIYPSCFWAWPRQTPPMYAGLEEGLLTFTRVAHS